MLMDQESMAKQIKASKIVYIDVEIEIYVDKALFFKKNLMLSSIASMKTRLKIEYIIDLL